MQPRAPLRCPSANRIGSANTCRGIFARRGLRQERFSRVGGADGLRGTRPVTVSLRPSSNRTGGFPASGFPKVIHSHRFYALARVQAAVVGSRYRP